MSRLLWRVIHSNPRHYCRKPIRKCLFLRYFSNFIPHSKIPPKLYLCKCGSNDGTSDSQSWSCRTPQDTRGDTRRRPVASPADTRHTGPGAALSTSCSSGSTWHTFPRHCNIWHRQTQCIILLFTEGSCLYRFVHSDLWIINKFISSKKPITKDDFYCHKCLHQWIFFR